MDGIDVSRANGNNILDGSTGSNFLTGGIGNDTFYLDNRAPDSPIFSTIVNFHAGDNVTVWGVNAADFKMLMLDNQGAAGFRGLDLIFTAPGHLDTSFVLAGYTSADLTNGRLSLNYGTTPNLPGLPGSQYLTVHGN
jgi:Ca2+-binding RTX toxin-like protein